MIQRATSFGLAALLAGMLIGGPCAACAGTIPIQEKADDCCAGHEAGDCCAPAHQTCLELAAKPEPATPVTAALAVEPAVIETADLAPVLEAPPEILPAYSPPDLYLLNATLLL